MPDSSQTRVLLSRALEQRQRLLDANERLHRDIAAAYERYWESVADMTFELKEERRRELLNGRKRK